MSDYAKQASPSFTARDALATGDPDKLIAGVLFDAEFDALVTAIASKYDSNDLASQAQAEAEASNTVLMTPLRVANWSNYNAGIVGDLQALADPGSDKLLGWDESENAAIAFAVATGLSFTTTTFGLTDVTAAATRPYKLTSGVWAWDDSVLDRFGETAWVPGTDGFYVSDAGNMEVATLQSLALPIQNAQTNQTLAAADMNSIMVFTGTATLTIDENATVDIPVGCAVVLVMDHATQVLTVQADTAVTLQSIFHPGGTANAADTVQAGGMAVLLHLADDVWQLSGDIAT